MSHELEITSTCSPAQYAAVLEKLLVEEAAFPAPGEPPKKGIIRGKIIGGKVTLYLSANESSPIFSGQILSSNDGMILRGNFHHAKPILIHSFIGRFFTILLSTTFLAAILYGSYTSGTFDFKTLSSLLLPIAFCTIMWFVISRVSRLEPGKLKQFIQRSFELIPPNR